MDERIYYTEPQTLTCEAEVMSCEKVKDGYEVRVNRTVIFPSGGGQPRDRGTVAGHEVLAARDDGEAIYYTIDTPLSVGDVVKLETQAEVRLDHSQQHSGEHIVSGLAKKLFGAANVGFHMAEDYMTIDLDMMLDRAQLSALESAANDVIYRDVPITYALVGDDELEHIELRKRSEKAKGLIRIVTIDGADSCTCCGTHVKSTGCIGAIKIVDFVKYKAGVRIWLACGKRAINDYDKKHTELAAIAKNFSTKWTNAHEAVMKQSKELASAKRELKKRTLELCDYKAKKLIEQAADTRRGKLVFVFEEDGGMDYIKTLSERICTFSNAFAAVFARCGSTIFYRLMRSEGVNASAGEICRAVNVALNGKGGGRDDSAQGSAVVSDASVAAIEQIKSYIRNVLNAK